MPWTGPNFIRHNEDYSGPTVWQSDAAASILIESVRHDFHDEDLAEGISACINKNGANTAAASIDWGGFKITNYGNSAVPSAADDVARFGQTVTAASLNPSTNLLTLTRADGNVTVDLTALVIGGSTANFAKLSTANEFAGINTFDQAPVSKAGFSMTPASGPVTLWRNAPDNSGKYSVLFSGTYNGAAMELIATGNNAGTASIFGKPIAYQADLAGYLSATGTPYTVTGNWTLTGAWNFNAGSVILPTQTTIGSSGGGWQTNISSNTLQLFSIATGAIVSFDTAATEGTRMFAGSNRVWTNGNARVLASGVPTGGLDNDIAYVQTGGSKGVWSKISGTWTLIAS